MLTATPTTIIPNYQSLALQFEKPMQHGDGRNFLTNPAIYNLPEKPVVFGRVLCLNERFVVAGPASAHSGQQLQNAAHQGSVERANRYAGPHLAAHLHLCHSQAAALAKLWELVIAKYQISDAAGQQAQVAARLQWEQSPEGVAQLAQAQQWLKEHYPAL